MLSAEPVCSCALCFVQTARETAGAARTRSSLRPLYERAGCFQQSSGASRREIVESFAKVAILFRQVSDQDLPGSAAAHVSNASSAGHSACPHSVSPYSTLGGT